MNMEVPRQQEPKDNEADASMSRFMAGRNRHLGATASRRLYRDVLDDQHERKSFELGEIERNLKMLKTMREIGLGERSIFDVRADELSGLIGLSLLEQKHEQIAEGLKRWAVFFSSHLITLADLVAEIEQSAGDNDLATKSALDMSRSMLSAAEAIVPQD